MAKTKQKPPTPAPAPAPAQAPSKLAFSIEELTQVSSLSKSFLYAEMAAGRLPYIKAGARRLVLVSAFESYLAGLGRPLVAA